MRIKCPRCGLVNKPEVKKCQSCGEDLSDLLDLDIDVDIKNRPDEVDPLSIDSIKKNRRRREKIVVQENEQNSLDLGWRDELKRRVSEIKKERESKHHEESLESDSDLDRKMEQREKRPGLNRKNIKDEILKSKSDFYRTSDDDEEISENKRKIKSSDQSSEVYDDDHIEDYDYEQEESEGPSEEEYEHKMREDKDRRIVTSDDETDDESDYNRDEVPKDPDDIKRYIEEKVARRRGRTGSAGRVLSEEYGYKPKSRGRTAESEGEHLRGKSRDSVSYSENEPTYESRTIYRPIDDEKQQTPSERLLSEETKSLINSKRIYAGVWDTIILLIFSFVIVKFGANATDVTLMQLFTASWFKLLVFYLVLYGFYNIYFIGSNGQTIGKMFMHIRLMTVERKQISFTRAFFHYVFSVIGIAFIGIGFFWFIHNRESRNWADLITGVKSELFRN